MIEVRPDWKPIPAEPKEAKPLKKTQGFRTSPKYLRDEFRFRVLHEFGGRCILADLHVCEGVLDAAHILPKQALRRRGLSEQIVNDPRDGVAACRLAHSRNDSGLGRFPRDLLPPAVFEFAREHNLTDLLDKLYPALSGMEEA